MTILLSLLSVAFAANDADTTIAAQKTACDKNTAMEWSSTLNRCVAKAGVVETRNEVNACDAITDQTARATCHMNLAEKNSSLSSDTSGLNQGKTSNSMLMNSITTAYFMINWISQNGKDGDKSLCTSKKILGTTSIAGLASDIYLKMKAKKKVKELEDKYKLDTSIGTTEAQVKALEYLKEEQETVAEIAALEKKRNMLLMAGYAAAAAFAVYEMTPFGAASSDCNSPNKNEGTPVKGEDKTVAKK